jgi:hypothetical protein
VPRLCSVSIFPCPWDVTRACVACDAGKFVMWTSWSFFNAPIRLCCLPCLCAWFGGSLCLRRFHAAAGGPAVDVVALLDTLSAAGLSEAIQDAVAAAVGDAPEVPLGSLRGLLTGVGVGSAAALRIVRQLVSVFGWLFMHTVGLGCVSFDACPPRSLVGCRAPLVVVATPRPHQLQRRPGGGWMRTLPQQLLP